MNKRVQYWWDHKIFWNDTTVYWSGETDMPALIEGLSVIGEGAQLREVEYGLIEQQINAYMQSQSNLHAEFTRIEDDSLLHIAQEVDENISLISQVDDGPIIKLLNSVFVEAIRVSASDIHIETFKPRSTIRFRIDGLLSSILTVSVETAERLVSRVKVLARLNIAEKRVPQDGRMTVALGSRNIDLRISTIPSVDGERVVLRLLESKTDAKRIAHLGLSQEQQAVLTRLVNKPNGILLATGPTGSGKTTTMYAALQSIDALTKNIMTVEDPVEYKLAGISQTPINHQQNMTFATGLKAILRQDPDVVLVGEIRDPETAKIAAQASLTGHLVLSTLHANHAVNCVTRLRDLEVEPYIIASSLRGIIAQRLLRSVCQHCRVWVAVDAAAVDMLSPLGEPIPDEIAKATGCEHCNTTGYLGRYGIFEVIEITDTMRSLIQAGAHEMELAREFSAQSPNLSLLALDSVRQGRTTLDEVARALGD